MKDRIKELRKALGLTQQEFADRIGINRGNVATYETREGNPGASVISLICREFNVNETWLRTGEGEMFIRRSKEDELAAFMNELLASESADFRRRLVTALSRLKPEQWDALEAVSLELVKDLTAPQATAPAFAPAPARTVEEEARAEAKEYYYQLLAEKEPAAKSPALPGDTGGSAPKMA